MTRTLRSHFKRWMLWRGANGRCEKCGIELPNRWHADHIIPWRKNHRTSVFEMQALCPKCNLKKGGRMPMFYDETKLRKGQRDALDVIIERLKNGCSHTAIVMATRYGKSDLQRIATLVAVDSNLISCAISLSPNLFLCDQMNEESKWTAFCRRLAINGIQPKHARIATCVVRPTANGEHFLSVSVPFFQRRLDYWIDFGKTMLQRTGKPVLLMVDECQFQSIVKAWGLSISEWQRRTGGAVVLLTATPDRNDGERIPGFEYSEISSKPVRVYTTRPGSTEETVWVDVKDGTETVTNIIAHHTTTFSQAWRENALCKIESQYFDVDLTKIDGVDSQKALLSKIKEQKEIRRALSRVVWDSYVIENAVGMFLKSISYYRSLDQRCGGIVFCGNDDDAEVNKHANLIKRELLRQNPSLKIHIATSAEEDGKEELDQFKDGDGNVVIVKQMASIGLDISRLKTGLDLSPIRARAMNTQRMMRIATPHEFGSRTMLVSTWISPFDLLAQANFEAVVRAHGGEATISDLKLIRSYEKDRNEPIEHPDYIVEGFMSAGAVDSDQNIATEAELGEINKLINAVPELVGLVTRPELVKRLHGANSGPTSADTGKQVAALYTKINRLAGQIVKMRMGQPYDPEEYRNIIREVWRDAKSASHIHQSVKLEQITDLQILDRLLKYFEGVLVELRKPRQQTGAEDHL